MIEEDLRVRSQSKDYFVTQNNLNDHPLNRKRAKSRLEGEPIQEVDEDEDDDREYVPPDFAGKRQNSGPIEQKEALTVVESEK